jgi:hypothetical protein
MEKEISPATLIAASGSFDFRHSSQRPVPETPAIKNKRSAP